MKMMMIAIPYSVVQYIYSASSSPFFNMSIHSISVLAILRVSEWVVVKHLQFFRIIVASLLPVYSYLTDEEKGV